MLFLPHDHMGINVTLVHIVRVEATSDMPAEVESAASRQPHLGHDFVRVFFVLMVSRFDLDHAIRAMRLTDVDNVEGR